MWRRLGSLLVTAVLLGLLTQFVCCAASVEKSKDFVVVAGGKAQATIVVGSRASEDELFAALELQDYIRKSSGVLVPVKTDDQVAAGNIIAVGRNKVNTDAKLGLEGLAAEAFRIKTTGSVLSLAGSDDAGTGFAVYEFLEKYLGVRWLWPGELGEVVPEHKTIVVGRIDDTQQPDYKWRNRGPGGALWGASTGPTEMHARELLLGVTREHQKEVELWEKRNKWGGMKIYGGHCLGEVFPPEKYGKTHPEYYALVKGKREVPGPDYDYKHGGQICTSNPEVIKVAVDWARDFFDKHPDYDGVHMTLNDGGGFCECDNCLALDIGTSGEKEGIDAEEMKTRPRRRRVITDRVYTFLNQIAEGVQKTHPGKYVVSMAYSRYITPPERVKLNPYVIPQYCLWSAYGHANLEEKAKHEEIAAGWAKAANKKGIYEYYINGSWPGLHRLAPYHFAESIKRLYSRGIDLYQLQSGDEFGVNGLNYYVAGRLLWDTSLDEQKILDDFYNKGFGKAGPAIKRFHKRLIDTWDRESAKDKLVSCYSLKQSRLLDYLTPELFEQCYADLAEAEKLADNDLIARRVEFYRKGLRYTQLTVDAARASKKIIDKIEDKADAFMFIKFLSNKKNKSLVENALAAWGERDAFAEQLKNDYVLSYFWVRYSNLTRYRFYVVNYLENMLKLFETEGLKVKSAH